MCGGVRSACVGQTARRGKSRTGPCTALIFVNIETIYFLNIYMSRHMHHARTGLGHEHDYMVRTGCAHVLSDKRVDYVGVLRLECGDELPQGEGGREELIGQHGAGERAGVVRAQPAEDLAPLVGVAVGRGHRVVHHLLRDWAQELLRHHHRRRRLGLARRRGRTAAAAAVATAAAAVAVALAAPAAARARSAAASAWTLRVTASSCMKSPGEGGGLG